jgi:O-antigen/teichoic acid export membrane protein
VSAPLEGLPPIQRQGIFPAGARSVAIGLVVSGLSAYVFLAWSARHLGPVRYAPLAAFWSVTYLVGPGCFGVLEKEVGRQLSHARTVEQYPAPIVRRIGRQGLVMAVILIVIATGLSPVLRPRLFNGSTLLMVSFVASLLPMWSQHMAWGVLAGNSDFKAYKNINAGEGLLRLLGCAVLIAVGISSAGPFGLVIAVAPLGAVVLTSRPLLRAQKWGPDVGRAVLTRSLLYLLSFSFLYSVFVNAGPIAVKVLAKPGQAALTGTFLSGLVIVRVPLFLYASASATLLPALTSHAAAGDWQSFHASLRRLSLLVGAVGALSTALAALVGPMVVRTVFGAGYALRRPDLALLAASAGALLLAATLSQALTAAGSFRALLTSWAVGLVVMVVLIAVVSPLFERVELGLLGGALSALVWMAACIRYSVGPQPAPAGLQMRAG